MSIYDNLILLVALLFAELLAISNVLPDWIIILTCFLGFSMIIARKTQIWKKKHWEMTSIYEKEISDSDKAIRLKSQQLLTMATNIPSPLALMDSRGQILMTNASFSEFVEADNTEQLNYQSRALNFEVRIFAKDAIFKEISLIKNIHINDSDFQALSVPIHENNRYSGCLLVFQDVTRLLEGERMQKRFIADASHELRTPLASIKGMSEILNRDDFDDDETRKEFLIQIAKESQRMENMIQELLMISRLSANKVPLNTKLVNLNDVIDMAYSTVMQEMRAKNVTFNKSMDDIPSIIGDPQKLYQIFTNLLVNAIQYTDSGEISITAKEIIDGVEIIVSDTGSGIPQKDIEHIFERFYRVESHRSRQSGGSGLGLAIVKSLVLAHNGSIKVISELGQGTSFVIILPL